MVDRAVAPLCGVRRAALLAGRPGPPPPRRRRGADRGVRGRPRDDRGRARLADRPLRRAAVLGPHAPARPAADRGAAADPARTAVAADVARPAGAVANERGAAHRSWTCRDSCAGAGATAAGVAAVQRDADRLARARRL